MSRDSNDAGDEDFSVVGTRGGAISRRGFIGGAFAISATGAILSQLQQTRALAAPPTFNPDGTVAFHAWDPAYLIYSDWYADGQSIFVTDAGYPGGGYYRVESSAAPVDGAYTVRYRFQVPESGLYDMRWSSTPPNVTWASPFYLAVNGNQYGYIGTGAGRYDQINPTVQCYDQGLEQFYNAATTLEANTATAPDPIALHTGLNTISFRVKDPRSLDGKYVMYLNSIALTPADPQPGSISQSKPLGVYSASDSVNFTVNMTAAIVTATTMTVMISDYWHTVVWTGTFAVPAGTHGILVAPPAPGLGYYQVDVTLAGGSQPIRSQFAVVSSSVPASSPFGSDVALTELVPTSRVSDYARAISLAGITRVRERYGWNVVNPSSGTYDYSSVDPALTAFSSHSTKVLAVYGQAPNWAVTGGNKLPADLRSIYNFAKAAGTHSAGTVATWEVWNEPDYGSNTTASEPADVYAAVVKAAALGYADSTGNATVATAGLAGGAAAYSQIMLDGGLLDYVDAYAYHGYTYAYSATGPVDYPFPAPMIKTHVDLVRSKSTSTGLWMTEAGMPIAASTPDGVLDPGSFGPTSSSAQRTMQARYAITSAVESLATGTDHHFWFVLPYYNEYGFLYGAFSPFEEPNPAYVAISALTRALGASAFAAKETSVPAGVSAYWFDDGTGSTLVIWSTTVQSVTVPVGPGAATVTNIVGQSSLMGSGGSLTLTVAPDPQFIRTTRTHIAPANPGAAIPSAPRARSLATGKRIVIQPVFPSSAAHYSKVYGAYQLETATSNSASLNVYNFSSSSQVCALSAAATGWSVAFSQTSVTVPAGGMVTVGVTITAATPAAAASEISFTSLVGGVASTCSIFVQPSIVGIATTSIGNSGTPSGWSTAGTNSIATAAGTGIVQFSFNVGPDGGGGYPALTLSGTIPTSAKGFAFDLYSATAESDTTNLAILVQYANSATYWTPTGYRLDAGWNKIIAPFSAFQFALFGGPDNAFAFNPQNVVKILIGVNTQDVSGPVYQIRNLGTYTF